MRNYTDEEIAEIKKKNKVLVEAEVVNDSPRNFKLSDFKDTWGKPVEEQNEIARKVKQYLDTVIENELMQFGKLTDSTRKWIVLYNDLLNNLHVNYGYAKINDIKSEITHSEITNRMRQLLKNGNNIS
jgi:hypothetical protein